MNELQKSLAVSIRGASHYKDNKPMQDYSSSVVGKDFAIAIVCDGHGADKHFRSEIGSKLATEITQSKLQDFYMLNQNYEQFNKDTSLKLARLKLAIIADWQTAVEKYTKENPFTEAELGKASPRLAAKMSYDVAQPYGSTLLATLVCRDYYLTLMIGDGAIIKIGERCVAEIVKFEGKIEYTDAPHSATDSLCQEDVHEKIYDNYGKIEAGQPIALALCSDGFTESLFFPKEVDIIKKAINYLNYYAEEGLEKTSLAVEAQLNEITKGAYPWDDISFALCTLNLSAFDKRLWKEVIVEKSEEKAVESQTAEPKIPQDDKEQAKNDVAAANVDNKLSGDDFTQNAEQLKPASGNQTSLPNTQRQDNNTQGNN